MEGALHLLVRRGDVQAAKAAISERQATGTPRELKELVGSRDPFGNTPLHYAAEGHPAIVSLLLACGSPVVVVDARNNEGSTPLHQAAFGNFYQCVQLLLDNGAFVNVTDYDGSTPLHHGAANNALESVTILLTHGASKETKDNDGYTALHHAAFNNSIDVLRLLLKTGSDTEARDSSEGTTALHLASFGGYHKAVELLVSAGADIHSIDNDGATPLHKAAFQGFVDCLDYLISRGADVNRKDNTQSTPLHLAAYQGKLECMERLVKAGAKLKETNKHGRTPLQLAIAKGHHKCAEFLKTAQEMPISSPVPPTPDSPHSTTVVPLEEDQLMLIDKLVDRGLGSTPQTKDEAVPVESSDPKKAQPLDETQLEEDKPSNNSSTSEPQTKPGASVIVIDEVTRPTTQTSAEGKHHNQPTSSTLSPKNKSNSKSKSTDNEDSSERSWRWNSDEEESEEKGWIFEEGTAEKRPRKQKTAEQSINEDSKKSTSDGESSPRKKKKNKKKVSERQSRPKDRDSTRDKDDKRVLHGLSKMIKTASFQISPRGRRKDTDDILERFAVLTSTEKDAQTNDSDSLDSPKTVEAKDVIAKEPSEVDLTENDGDGTLTAFLSDSDDSDDEFGEKEINYSKLDKYGFLKDDTDASDTSSKHRQLEASRALKWSKIIQHWATYKRKKKLPRIKERVVKGIPDCVRGTVWKLVVDAAAVQKELSINYAELCSKAHNTKDARQIDLDIKRTYRNHFMFREKKGFGQKALSNILKAYSIFNTEIGYCQGMADLAALLVMYMEEEEAWWTLVALIKRYAMQGLFSPGFPRLFQCFDVHEKLLQRHLPALQVHFTKCGIETAMYATKWYMDIFLGALPFPVTLRVWDLYMWGGPDVVYRFSLSVLKYFESELLTLNFEDALSFINELPKRRINISELIKVYKKMQTTIKTSRIVRFEDEYAATHPGMKYLVYRRDHLIAPDTSADTKDGKSRSNRGGTFIAPKSKSSDPAPTPPMPTPASTGVASGASTLRELLKSM